MSFLIFIYIFKSILALLIVTILFKYKEIERSLVILIIIFFLVVIGMNTILYIRHLIIKI